MNNENKMGETVWRQLIDYIESCDLFFPAKIRQNISDDAREIFESYLALMKAQKMLIKFEKKSLTNRIALWLYRFRLRKREHAGELLEIFIKGPAWQELKDKTLSELTVDKVQTD